MVVVFSFLATSAALAAPQADSLRDPLLQLNSELTSSLRSRERIDEFSTSQKCTYDFLKSLGWKFQVNGRSNGYPVNGFECTDGFSPTASFASDDDMRRALDQLATGRATKCLYRLRVEKSVTRAAAIMEGNDRIVFDTKSGSVEWKDDGTFKTSGGSFFSCSGRLKESTHPIADKAFNTNPFEKKLDIPWGCVVTDPCTSVQAFIAGLLTPSKSKDGKTQSPQLGMDCANAVQANQYVYTYLKFDLDNDGVMNDRECRIFTEAYNDRNWEFSPFRYSPMTKNPFVGKDIETSGRSSQELARDGAPYLSGARAILTMKSASASSARKSIGANGYELEQEHERLIAKSRAGKLSSNEQTELAKISEKILKTNFMNENLVITKLSKSAADQWAGEEFTGNPSAEGLSGRFEQEYRKVLVAARSIRDDGLKDRTREIHVAEVILANEDYHRQLLNPKHFPLKANGKDRDFSALRGILKQMEPSALEFQAPDPNVKTRGKINGYVVDQIQAILEVLLQPRFRGVSIYSHPAPNYRENANLASLVLRQFGAHKNQQLSFKVYPDTEETEQFRRFSDAIRSDCEANLK